MKNFLSRISAGFQNMPSKKRKNIILGIIVVAAVIGLMMVYPSNRSNNAAKREEEKKKHAFDLGNPDNAKDSWVESGQRKLSDMERKLRDLENKMRQMESQGPGQQQPAQATDQPILPGSSAEREAKLLKDLQKLGVTTTVKSEDLAPPSPVKPAIAADAVPNPQETPEQFGISRAPAGSNIRSVTPGGSSGQQGREPIPADRPQKVMGVYNFSSMNKAPTESPTTAPAAQGQPIPDENFYTPTGAFFKVRLLTGLDAPAGPNSSAAPHPVLLRIQDLSWLPNELRQNVMGCFVLGEAYGDLATERATIRGINLSCVNKDNRYVLDEEIQGYLTDSDGKLGLRGRVVSKQGQFLARALMASFIEGIAKGFDTSVNTTVVTGGGVVTTDNIDGFTDGFKKGASSGFTKAAEKMSDFYLKSAEQLYPIIEVGADRGATFVITRGKRFAFDKTIIEGVGLQKTKLEGQL